MKNTLCLLLVLLTVLLAGCRQPAQPTSTEPTTIQTAPTELPTTEPPTTEPPTTEPPETEPPTTEPLHSEFYLEDVPVETVITWFNEVCLDTEYYGSGDPTLVQKWDVPIAYCLQGDFDQEDAAVLDSFAQWLNTLEGFPGITRVEDMYQANLQIHFTDAQGLLDIMGPEFSGLDGAIAEAASGPGTGPDRGLIRAICGGVQTCVKSSKSPRQGVEKHPQHGGQTPPKTSW